MAKNYPIPSPKINTLKPKKQTIANILNFSKSFQVQKVGNLKIELHLN